MQKNRECWFCGKDLPLKEGQLVYRCECGVEVDITPYKPYVPNGAENGGEMKPPARAKNFEKVAIGEMLPGEINEVLYDQEHKFKGFQGAEDTIQPAVRFKFLLDNYQHPHYSRWMKFSYGEKSNLYKIFLSKLVENAQPDMDCDLDVLKGMRIKTLWNENGDFQNLESIFPAVSKVKATEPLPSTEPELGIEPGEEDETI